MKISQGEANQKIAEFTESNILGTAIVFMLIVYVLEPVTDRLTNLLKDKAGSFFKSKIKLPSSVQAVKDKVNK